VRRCDNSRYVGGLEMTPELSAGRSVGRYRLSADVGKTDLGHLWLVVPNDASRVLFMRRVPTEGMSAAEIERLTGAARWAVGLEHPQLLSLRDVVVDTDHVSACMDYVSGETLRALLRAMSFKRAAIEHKVALSIARDVLQALVAVRAKAGSRPELSRGMLAPDSIWVTTDGRALVAEAGITAVMRSTPRFLHQVDWMAYSTPDQLDPKLGSDDTSDVFSLGILLWECMMSGRRLFLGSNELAVMDRVKSQAIPRLDEAKPTLPKSIADFVARALARDRAERFPSPEAALEALGTFSPDAFASRLEVGEVVRTLCQSALSTRKRWVERALPANTKEEIASDLLEPASEAPVSANGGAIAEALVNSAPQSSVAPLVDVAVKSAPESSAPFIDALVKSAPDVSSGPLSAPSPIEIRGLVQPISSPARTPAAAPVEVAVAVGGDAAVATPGQASIATPSAPLSQRVSSRRPLWFGLAAAAALLVGIVVWITRGKFQANSDSRATSATLLTSVPEVPPAPTTPAASQENLSQPEISVPSASEPSPPTSAAPTSAEVDAPVAPEPKAPAPPPAVRKSQPKPATLAKPRAPASPVSAKTQPKAKPKRFVPSGI
jgi:serine/threonine protein kinase